MTATLPFRRVGKYPGHPAVVFDPERVIAMVREGATNEDICAAFRCCTRTFERWRQRNPAVNDLIKAERERLAALFRW